MNDAAQPLVNHGGAVLFALVFIEEAGLPLPAAPWLLAAGALWAGGRLNPISALALVTLAAMIADSAWFYIGRRNGPRVLRLFCRLSLARTSCVGRSKNLFERRGFQALMVAKFLPGLGTVMPPLAGAMGMSTSRFLLFDGLGSLVYGASYIVVGFVFHNQLQHTMAVLHRLGFSALLLAVALIAGYIAFRYARRRQAPARTSGQRGAVRRNARPALKEGSFIPAGSFGSAVLTAGSLRPLELQNIALTANPASQRTPMCTPASPVLHTS